MLIENAEEQQRHRRPGLQTFGLWSLARNAAVVGIGLLVVSTVALLLPDDYIDQMETVLPKPIRDYVHEHHVSPGSTAAAASRPSRSRVFALGATTSEVLAIEGRP